jgi:hypothetical protein
MQHRPLPDIRKYALLSNQQTEFYAIVKPEGMDVFINDGKFYDFYHNELKSQYLSFHFEKLLKTSVDMKMTIVGVLTSNNILEFKRYRHTLYGPSRSPFTSVRFVAYDTIFPVFNAEHIYQWRYDIVKKVIGQCPNCLIASLTEIKNEQELQKLVKDVFTIDTGASVIVYRKDGKFVPGSSQLTYDDDDTVSYIIEATQRYRAHIKKVVSTTLKFDDGNKIEVALYILAKFKKEHVEIPIDQSNFVLRRFIWENRQALKEHPFWFTGYTLLDNNGEKLDYITVINQFLSFISTPQSNGN